MSDVVIVDYGGGNLGSVAKLFSSLEIGFEIATDAQRVASAKVVVLPGQGAIAQAMHQLKSLGLDLVLQERAAQNRPLLGICLGMQLMVDWSDEDGGHPGLGIFPGKVVKFSPELGIKVPHMGWNQLELVQDPEGYFSQIPMPAFAYFAHSYTVTDVAPELVITTTFYGVSFPSIIGRGAVMGIQPHPEKSGDLGRQLIKAYLKRWVAGE